MGQEKHTDAASQSRDPEAVAAHENDQLRQRNHALAKALTRATEELRKAKAQLEQFMAPPLTMATMVACIAVPPMSMVCGMQARRFSMATDARSSRCRRLSIPHSWGAAKACCSMPTW